MTGIHALTDEYSIINTDRPRICRHEAVNVEQIKEACSTVEEHGVFLVTPVS